MLYGEITADELRVFLEESDEQLQHLDENIIRLEVEGEDVTLLQEIFRAAHTLKGSSATIGHKKMADVTHSMEGLLDKLRTQQLKPTIYIVDALLAALDVLKIFREEIASGKEVEFDINPVLMQLKRQVESRNIPTTNVGKLATGDMQMTGCADELSQGNVAKTLASGEKSYVLTCTIARSSAWKPLRCLQVLNEIKQIGNLISSQPTMKQIENGQVNGELRLVFSSNKETGELTNAVETIDEVENVKIINCESRTENQDEVASISHGEPVDCDVRDCVNQARVDGEKVFSINVAIRKDSAWKPFRCQQVLNKIQQIGNLLLSNPSQNKIYEEFTTDNLWILMNTLSDREMIISRIKTIDEIIEVTVSEYGEAAGAILSVTEETYREASLDTVVGFKADAPQLADKQLDSVSDKVETATVKELLLDQKKNISLTGPGEKLKPLTSVRVGVKVLDKLMNIVEELVMDRSRISEASKILEARYQDDLTVCDLRETSNHIEKVINELHQDIMKVRMMPMSTIFNKFPRMLRDLARKQGKKIIFTMEGERTELDRSLVEQINDPLIHLIRNSVDHGIEAPGDRIKSGKPEKAYIKLSACHEEGHIIIKVQDDGKGIDPESVKKSAVKKGFLSEDAAGKLSDNEAINLVFVPGLSTNEETTDVSGRGVGLDIVKTNVEKLNGSVLITTEINQGTTFTIKLPLTVAVFKGLMVFSETSIYIIPLASVVETLKIKKSDIVTIVEQEVIHLRESIIPILRMGDTPGTSSLDLSNNAHYVVIVKSGNLMAGILVDRLLEQQEFVIKSLDNYLGDLKGIAAATILGSGQTALILDIPALLRNSPDRKIKNNVLAAI